MEYGPFEEFTVRLDQVAHVAEWKGLDNEAIYVAYGGQSCPDVGKKEYIYQGKAQTEPNQKKLDENSATDDRPNRLVKPEE